MITALASVPAPQLQQGDVIHLEPHVVRGQLVGHRTLDVEVTGTHRADWHDNAEVIVDWRESAQLVGADPRVTGATVYGHLQRVLVLSRPERPDTPH